MTTENKNKFKPTCSILDTKAKAISMPKTYPFKKSISDLVTFKNKNGRVYVFSVHGIIVRWAFGQPGQKTEALKFAQRKYNVEPSTFTLRHKDVSSISHNLAPNAYKALAARDAGKEADAGDRAELEAVYAFIMQLIFEQEVRFTAAVKASVEKINPFKLINRRLGRHTTYGTKHYKAEAAASSGSSTSLLEAKVDLKMLDSTTTGSSLPMSGTVDSEQQLRDRVVKSELDLDKFVVWGCTIDQPGDIVLLPYTGEHKIQLSTDQNLYLVNLDGKSQPKVESLFKYYILPVETELDSALDDRLEDLGFSELDG
jgi:hypothetical protein